MDALKKRTIYTTPNHHPTKMDVLPNTCLHINLAAKWLVLHSRTPPNQQRRPLPSLQYLSVFYAADVWQSAHKYDDCFVYLAGCWAGTQPQQFCRRWGQTPPRPPAPSPQRCWRQPDTEKQYEHLKNIKIWSLQLKPCYKNGSRWQCESRASWWDCVGVARVPNENVRLELPGESCVRLCVCGQGSRWECKARATWWVLCETVWVWPGF